MTVTKDLEYERILDVWDELDKLNPDKSTEWMLQMTCDLTKAELTVVVDALYERQKSNTE